MNPRVSRSSALASKATGFPIAKIAAKLAIGYTLDEIPNDITRETPASFEPTLDYVVVKVPRFAFEKFPGADPRLTTHMKSVGEAMAIGRNFTEALQKALRSLERRDAPSSAGTDDPVDEARAGWPAPRVPHDGRLRDVQQALRAGATVDELHDGDRHRPVVPRPARRCSTRSPPRCATRPSSTATCCAGPSGTASPTPRSAGCRGMPEDVVRGVRHALGHPAGLQDRRHLRGGVRGADAVPLLVLRRGDRGRARARSRR